MRELAASSTQSCSSTRRRFVYAHLLLYHIILINISKGAWIVNTARGAICDKDAIAEALKSGQISGYSGDVWNVQPAPRDHVWRTMKNPLGAGNGMVPHYSGTTLDAQERYAKGTREILENYFNDAPQNPANIIVGKSEFDLNTQNINRH
jgi:formate dehydrogenase